MPQLSPILRSRLVCTRMMCSGRDLAQDASSTQS